MLRRQNREYGRAFNSYLQYPMKSLIVSCVALEFVVFNSHIFSFRLSFVVYGLLVLRDFISSTQNPEVEYD